MCRQTGAHSDVAALGKATKVDLSLEIKEKLSEYALFGSIKRYKRILIHVVTYTSKSYTWPVKWCDYAIKYILSGSTVYGLVEIYLCCEEQLFAVIQAYLRL